MNFKRRRNKPGMCDYPGCTNEAARVVISVFPPTSAGGGSTRARFCTEEHATWWMQARIRKEETKKDRQ